MRSQIWKRLVGKNTHGNTCHWLVTKESSIFDAQKSTSFEILYCVLEGSIKIQMPKYLEEKEWFTTFHNYRDYDGISGEPTEFELNIFPGFTTLQLCDKINNLLSSLGQTPATFTGRILFMSMFNDISCDRKGNEEECLEKCRSRQSTCKKIWYWAMVVYWTKFWKEVVFCRE